MLTEVGSMLTREGTFVEPILSQFAVSKVGAGNQNKPIGIKNQSQNRVKVINRRKTEGGNERSKERSKAGRKDGRKQARKVLLLMLLLLVMIFSNCHFLLLLLKIPIGLLRQQLLRHTRSTA